MRNKSQPKATPDVKHPPRSKDIGVVTVDDFERVHWHVALRTYGNAHATLIGLLVDWWVSRDKNRNFVVEPSPAFNPLRTGLKGRGHCDALLCTDGEEAVGVLEVEGEKRQELTARKVGKFFGSRDEHLFRLQFAVLLLYTFRGHRAATAFAPSASPEAIKAVMEVSKTHRDKDIFVIDLEKVWEPTVQGIRSRSVNARACVRSIAISRYHKGVRRGKPRLLRWA